MKKAINLIGFALGLVIGIAGLAMGESRLVPVMGLTQGAADGLYVNVTGDTVTGPLAVDGNTTLGDAAGDTVTSNADRWLWPNASTFVFSKTIVLDATVSGGKFRGAWEFVNDLTASADTFLYGDTVIGTGVGHDLFLNLGTVWLQKPQTWNVDGNWTVGASGFQLIWSGDNFSWTGPFFIAGNLTTTEDTSFGNGAGDTHAFVGDSLDATGVTNVTIPDANAATEAMNQQTSDARYILLGSISLKAGTVAGASFAGNPKIFTVTFNTAFPNTNYAVTVISEESRTWTFQSKLAGSFVMNSNANLALTLNVDWTATAHIDP